MTPNTISNTLPENTPTEFFAVIGKNQELSMTELGYLEAKNIQKIKKNIISFTTDYPERAANLGGCIKIGKIYQEKDLVQVLDGIKIIGIQEETIGKHFKKTLKVKRFKLVDINHTDKEIKNKGKEIINLDNGIYGVVEQYQNIHLYEVIDFEKPGRSMQMGMMPAKLTHIMLNIGLANCPSHNDLIIYDPFIGSGTTALLANYFGYSCLGSDINIGFVTKNKERRKGISYAQDTPIDIFLQDVTKPLPTKYIPQNKDMLIVTEGWLGPIVREQSTRGQIEGYQDEVFRLYNKFLDMITFIKGKMTPGTNLNAIFTIPYYPTIPNYLEEKLTANGKKNGLKITSIEEVYQRQGQNIARKILLLSA